MSINVNVSGNPVSIKRGKLITTDLDYTDDEIRKRRRIRLEQVRQQSKGIAEQVRNKVRDGKSKQLSDIEKQGEKELKKWQNRKLLALQQQYQECLKDIGLGHAQAVLEEESEAEYEQQNDDHKQIAKIRGQEAAKKQNEKIHLQDLDKARSNQKKKLNRQIENARSKMVANLGNRKHKSPFKKKKQGKLATDINISTRQVTDRSETETTSETEGHGLLNISSASSLSCKDETNRLQTAGKSTEPLVSSTKTKAVTEKPHKVSSYVNERSNAPLESDRNLDYYINTQISDRIRNRPALKSFAPTNSNVCDVDIPAEYSCCCQGQKSNQVSSNTNVAEPINTKVDEVKSNSITTIPNKPPMALRQVQSTSNSSNLNKVQYCDYKNRYSKEYIPTQTTIERIPEESVEVCPSPRSEVEYIQRMYKRDQEAEQRGKKALAKEKVHRDYKDMMRQLPTLQKQERIASISSNKSPYHMSDDRLKDYEKRHQNRMENAYENLFPKPQVVTLPPKCPKETSTLPFQTISINDSNPPILNVGSWDFDFKFISKPHIDPKQITSDLVQEAAHKISDDSDPDVAATRRQEQLQEMWKTLTAKREKLAKEINELPENSKLRKMLAELGGLDQFINLENVEKNDETSKINCLPNEDLKKACAGGEASNSGLLQTGNVKKVDRGVNAIQPDLRTTVQTKVCSTNTSPQASNICTERICREKPCSRYHSLCTDTSSSPLPEPKCRTTKIKVLKHKKLPPPLVLQNTSTQTTPFKEPETSKLKENDPHSKEVVVSGLDIHKTSESNEKLQSDAAKHDTMCQILIKIDEEGKPQICVGPSKLKNKEIIVKTGVKKTIPVVENSQNHSRNASEVEESVLGVPPKTKSKHNEKLPEKFNQDANITRMSWKDYLSQNSTNTSTSYNSPPDLATNLIKEPISKKSCHHLAGILKDKPQQHNIQSVGNSTSTTSSSHPQTKDPNVCPLKCIKKLLTMSRQSIEDLQVSAVSDVSTPGSSIIQTKSNVPANIAALKGLGRLSESTDKIFNCNDNTAPTPQNLNNTENEQDGSNKMTFDEYCATNYPNVMTIYNKLAENCVKKIEYLASLLEQNRIEKLNLISPSGSNSSDKDSSTKYLELPPELSKQKKVTSTRNGNNKSSSTSAEQDDLNQQLLEIDYNLVEHLKTLTPAEIKNQYPLNNLSISDATPEDTTDQDLVKRFRNLIEGNEHPCHLTAVSFPPLLINVPNLPILETEPLNENFLKSNNLSKPPPSKGLTIARRFNTEIDSIPHQLSTIIESETLLSSKAHIFQTLDKDKTKQESDQKSSTSKNVKLHGPAKVQYESSEVKKTSSSDSLPDILTELMKDVQTTTTQTNERPYRSTDSSVSEIENIEAMLHSLGMGSWALATLRKTQEALAIPSSSSSVENSSNHKLTDSGSLSSEAFVRELGGLRNNESHGSLQFMRDLRDMSTFDKTTRKTSTPIHSSTLSDRSKSNISSDMGVSAQTSSLKTKHNKS